MIQETFTPSSIEVPIRVRYAETDAMGIVHHASYVIWLEQARTDLLRAQGTSYRDIEAAGYFIVLSDLQVRYVASARYDDTVLVRATLVELRSRKLSFDYTLYLADASTVLVTARTEHIVVARATGKSTRLPAELLARLQAAS